MSRYDPDIEQSTTLNEHGKYVMQFARNHGISIDEAYEHPMVKAHAESLRHLRECFNFANGNMRY